ncbi:hypothetical protein AXG93_4697s1050 [Marchantia polymorpha subsp. ruderalis]|uniref:Uncharacterized protein n=1 Tax=Marchantia polymorpha subsp. ruderalis TaxID=1480154 RepID=A0A176VNG1_MARPO|nr:hypothetical protein AXG93_4697s1050 [Marchantia polymorpha subsp. ruderalis]
MTGSWRLKLMIIDEVKGRKGKHRIEKKPRQERKKERNEEWRAAGPSLHVWSGAAAGSEPLCLSVERKPGRKEGKKEEVFSWSEEIEVITLYTIALSYVGLHSRHACNCAIESIPPAAPLHYLPERIGCGVSPSAHPPASQPAIKKSGYAQTLRYSSSSSSSELRAASGAVCWLPSARLAWTRQLGLETARLTALGVAPLSSECPLWPQTSLIICHDTL